MLTLLSTLDLPRQVENAFAARYEFVSGSIVDAADIRPDVLLCSIASGALDRRAIMALPAAVTMIATYSVGHDHIDLEAARERGIAVFNTPAVLSDSVADTAMLLILGAARRVTESIALLRSGAWSGWSPTQLLGCELAGKTLGILGMGDIGRRVARRAEAFGMTIAYHNRQPLEDEPSRYVADPLDLVAGSDVLLLAWPSTDATRRFIDSRALSFAKDTLILVNIGRGDLVDDHALINALSEKRILAAGLDVFDGEPNIDERYVDLPNAFLLPHIGSSTVEARVAMGQILIDAIDRHLAGGQPANRIA